jgi:hypothetical protein
MIQIEIRNRWVWREEVRGRRRSATFIIIIFNKKAYFLGLISTDDGWEGGAEAVDRGGVGVNERELT